MMKRISPKTLGKTTEARKIVISKSITLEQAKRLVHHKSIRFMVGGFFVLLRVGNQKELKEIERLQKRIKELKAKVKQKGASNGKDIVEEGIKYLKKGARHQDTQSTAEQTQAL